jgi:hypothetical protein
MKLSSIAWIALKEDGKDGTKALKDEALKDEALKHSMDSTKG